MFDRGVHPCIIKITYRVDELKIFVDIVFVS